MKNRHFSPNSVNDPGHIPFYDLKLYTGSGKLKLDFYNTFTVNSRILVQGLTKVDSRQISFELFKLDNLFFRLKMIKP